MCQYEDSTRPKQRQPAHYLIMAMPLPVCPTLPLYRYNSKVLRRWVIRCAYYAGMEARKAQQDGRDTWQRSAQLEHEILLVLRQRDKADVGLTMAANRAYFEGKEIVDVLRSL